MQRPGDIGNSPASKELKGSKSRRLYRWAIFQIRKQGYSWAFAPLVVDRLAKRQVRVLSASHAGRARSVSCSRGPAVSGCSPSPGMGWSISAQLERGEELTNSVYIQFRGLGANEKALKLFQS